MTTATGTTGTDESARRLGSAPDPALLNTCSLAGS